MYTYIHALHVFPHCMSRHCMEDHEAMSLAASASTAPPKLANEKKTAKFEGYSMLKLIILMGFKSKSDVLLISYYLKLNFRIKTKKNIYADLIWISNKIKGIMKLE